MQIGYLLGRNSKLKLTEIASSVIPRNNNERKKGREKNPPNIDRGTILAPVWLGCCKHSLCQTKSGLSRQLF